MTLPGGIQDREYKKFDLNSDNEVIVRTSAEGTFVPSGMSDFRVTTMEVTDTVTTLPTAAFAGRKSMSVYVISGGNMYIGPENTVTAGNALGTTAGWPIFASSTANIDFSSVKTIYAIAGAGETILIKLIEYSG